MLTIDERNELTNTFGNYIIGTGQEYSPSELVLEKVLSSGRTVRYCIDSFTRKTIILEINELLLG